jgi:uncharacterized protein YlaI
MSDETFNQRQWKNKPVQTMECMNCGLVRSSVVKACQQCGSLAAVSASLLNAAERDIEPVGVTFDSGKWAMGITRAPTADATMEGNAGGDALQRAQAELAARRANEDQLAQRERRLDERERQLEARERQLDVRRKELDERAEHLHYRGVIKRQSQRPLRSSCPASPGR